jgi:acyl-coenzyme A synthetase/AMP-(fatty) acid ligase
MKTASIFDVTAGKRKVKKEQKAWKYIQDLCSLNDADLNKLAVIDGNRKYTYSGIFREWERYASVFTALDMTEEQNARVGILGSTCAEVIIAFYGLNMVGAQVSLVASWSAFNAERIKQTILQEKLTDFILTDDLAQPDLVGELLLKREELGLNHVIILHVHMAGATSSPMMTAAQETKYAFMKTLYRPICMETLLASFGYRSVRYSRREIDETAFIIHTTGTTSGVGKPVPLSDAALNAAVERFMMLKDLSLPYDHLVSTIMVDLSNSYGIIDQVHLPFAMGATVVTIPFGFLNPLYYKAISTYRVSFFFSVSSMFERWLKLPDDTPFDFSSLKFVALGGTAVSAAEKKRYHEFLEAHGGKDVTILNGYGLSELGGACCLSSPELDDETIGYPMPGITIRLRDEKTGRFFSPGKKGGEGVLYMTADSMAAPKLDGKDIIKVEIIERKPYICTNDLVRVDPDGRITYLGRANRFFMREEGRKYESGRVEAEFSRLEDIGGCAVLPVYRKLRHDTIPMLCIESRKGAGDPRDVARKAFCRVFIEEKTLTEDDIPSRVMLAEMLPRNANGKIDMYQLNRGEVSGDIYTVDPVREQDRISDFILTPCQDDSGDIVEQIMVSITDDFKNRTPANPEDYKLYEYINSMFYMHQQMMNNMFGMIDQWFPWVSPFMPFGRMPEKQKKEE